MPVLDLTDDDIALLDLARKAGGVQGIDIALRAKALHDKLYTHKDTALDYQKAIKVVLPDARVASDVAAPYVAKIDEGLSKIDKFIADRAKEREEADQAKAQGTFEERWSSAVKDHELTAEGEEKLGKFMQNRGIADPEAAALLYFKQNPKPATPIAPTSIAPQNWAREMGISHADDDSSATELMANPQQWEAKEAAAVLTELRRNAA